MWRIPMAERYFKRYRMKFDCRRFSLPEPRLPQGFRWVPWSEELLEAHAYIKADCFRGEIDSTLFPCLANLAGCRKLMSDIAYQSNFLPRATWLIEDTTAAAGKHRYSHYCGTIQGMSRAFRVGAIQNVGITREYRGQGLGKALVARSLIGFAESGVQRVFLDVTAANVQAVALYERLGFRIESLSYQTVKLPESLSPALLARNVPPAIPS
ncbi:GNAT family N-acetyltransferase [Rubinisphaera sp. JC750]|uniref:GNAT family N-acetyltransferase n=1 Tax=Rubinisphaera sp. JC750 TaxID=2898658 RepID=UPI001EFFD503|nr:GNAT family N-acetyltransferase [Rubinisphaera sp. JC750]